VENRNPLGHLRQACVRELDGVADRSNGVDHGCDHVPQHGDNVVVVGDVTELGVQGHVLGEVADGVVRLGAKDRTDLVDAFEHADHGLLVELR